MAALGLVAAGLAASQAHAATMYGTLNNGSNPSVLVQLNPVTGALIQNIGPVGYVVNGLEYAGGKLYGSTGITDPNFPAGLIEINPLTGAGTPIGTGFGLGGPVVAITSNSGGQLYGWLEPGSDDLAAISAVTGLASVVGDAGIGTGELGLAFDGANNLFLVNGGGGTHSINPVTGVATFRFDLFTTAHHGDFNPDDGLYYGIDAASGSATKNLVVASLTAGGGSVVTTIPTVDNLHTVTFVVPEPAGMALGFGFAALGFAGLRRWSFRNRE